MSDTELGIEPAEEKVLRLKKQWELERPGAERDGQVYSEMLRQLQIDPVKQAEWFTKNLLRVRKKGEIQKLILKGDEKSLRVLSDKLLTALGKLTWATDRGWLIPADQLNEGEEPLVYKLPTERTPGCHDRFYPPMEAMWREMRNQIYTVDRPATPPPESSDAAEQARPGRRKKHGWVWEEPIPPKTYDHSQIWMPIPDDPDEITPAGKWSERQSEEAILHIIRTLNNARLNSNPEVFERVFQRFLARLGEIEYVDELNIPYRGTGTTQNEHETEVTTTTPAANDNEDTEMGLDESSIDELQADHYLQPESNSRQKSVLTTWTKEKQPGPMTTQSRIVKAPTGSLSSYLPAAYPTTMAIYITPFSSSGAAVPYSWVDAPVLPSSYKHFVTGVCLRADVPRLPRGRDLVIALAYGWNDFCRVLRNEQDWIEGFQKDIRRSAEIDRVDVWRLRVCCFA